MKTTKLFSLLVLLLLSIPAFAQKVTIKGTILDRDNQEAIAYADVVAYLESDTTGTTADVGITDDKGHFTLELPSGAYRVEVEYLGYKKSVQKLAVTGETDTQTMKTIRLRSDAEMLEGAVVVAKAIAVQTKADTVEYSASAVKVPEGSNVEALLKKLPGAQISSDGKITVNGKEIKKILVNGKEFFSDDPQIALKNLPANIVDKIKSYDKQSDEARLTGMDDNDEEGVLDLKIKKGMMQGWMGNVKGGLGASVATDKDFEGNRMRYDGSFLLNRFDDDQQLSLLGQGNNINQQGYSERGGAPRGSGNGINSTAMTGLNYVKDKGNLKYGGNAQYGFSKTDSKKRTLTDYKKQDLKDSVITTEHRKRHNFGLDFQTEWKPNTLSTFQFRPNASFSKTDMTKEKEAWTYNRSSNSRTNTGTDTENENLNLGGNFRYVQQFSAKKGRNLSVSARVNYSKSHTTKEDNSVFGTAEGPKQLPRNTYDNGHNESYNASAAFTEPISSHHLMQLRYTFQYRNAHQTDYAYDDTDSVEAIIDSISSDVKNYYTAHETEINLQGKYTKLKYKVGFNWAPQLSASNDEFRLYRDQKAKVGGDWQLDNFAPNLMLRYQFSKKHSIMFRYRGQAAAPNIEYLQEYIDISDPLDISMGNEDLKPTYTNRVFLRYNNYFSEMQSNLSANASFNNTMNEISNEIRFDSTEIGTRKITQKKNINGFGSWNSSAFITYNTPIPNSPVSLQASTRGSLSEKVGLAYDREKNKSEENKTLTRGYTQDIKGTYSKDDYEFSIFTSYGLSRRLEYDLARKSWEKLANPYEDFSIGGNMSVALPWKLNLGSDFTYTNLKGYKGLTSDERNKHVWNAEISRSLFKNNAGNVRLRWVDILNDTRTTSVNETGVSTVESTELWTLGSYFMVYFSYKFNSFGTSAQDDDKEGNGKFDFAPGGPQQRGGFGGGQGYGGPRGEGGRPRGEWNGERRRPDFEADTTAGNAPREGYKRGERRNRSNGEVNAEGNNEPANAPARTNRGQKPATEEPKAAVQEVKNASQAAPATEGNGEKPQEQPTETNQQEQPSANEQQPAPAM